MKSGNINQFKHLSQFDSIKSFNSSIEQWMVDYKSEFTKSELIALRVLKRYAAKVYGVCFACVNTLIKATSQQGEPISESTFHRMRRKAIKIGIIKVITTRQTYGKNKNRQGANIWVFQAYKSDDTLEIEDDVQGSPTQKDSINSRLTPPKTNKLSKTNNIKNIRKTFNCIKDIPDFYQEWLESFNCSPKQIVEFWRCVRLATRYLTHYSKQDKINLGIRAFEQMYSNKKLGYKVKNAFAYYTTIIHSFLDREYNELIVSC